MRSAGLVPLLMAAQLAWAERWEPDQPLESWNVNIHEDRATPRARLWDRHWLERASAVVHYEQLMPVFERLEAGLPITVVGLGSSVLAHYGGCLNSRSSLLRQTLHVRKHVNTNPESCEPHGWIGSFMSDLNHSWPHSDHLYINLGQPGAEMENYAKTWCFSGTLPKEVDLFLLESHEGWNFYASKGAAIETLFVQLGHRGRSRSSPAMVFLTTMFVIDIWWWEPWKTFIPVDRFEKCLQTKCVNATACSDFQTSLLTYKTGSTYGDGGEDSFAAVMHWYGYSVLSFRNAFVSALRDSSWGMSSCDLSHAFYSDPIHPTPTGMLLFADLLQNHFRAGYEFFKAVQAGGRLEDHRRRPPAMPLTPGAWRVPRRRCYDVATSAGLPVVADRTRGWTWVEETRPDQPYTKPGWLTNEPGAVLTVQVSSMLRPRDDAALVELTLTYLTSYEHMGAANVSCVSGCTCVPMVVNATAKSRVSVEATMTTNVTQSRECTLVIINAQAKFKVLGVTIEAYVTPLVDFL